MEISICFRLVVGIPVGRMSKKLNVGVGIRMKRKCLPRKLVALVDLQVMEGKLNTSLPLLTIKYVNKWKYRLFVKNFLDMAKLNNKQY